jgi:hypothetical protein
MAEVLRVVGAVAGIAGLGVGVLLLVYRDFIRSFFQTMAFHTLVDGQIG